MLAITAKVRLLKEEVYSAKIVCKDIIGSLKALKTDSDFRKEIGIFAVQAPNWKILVDEKSKMINVIRQICTGELSPEDAISLFEVALQDLTTLDKWLQVPQK